MLSRGGVAIDLGTVNTLIWVDGRGLVLEEPSAIAVDDATGAVAAIGSAADVLADKEPKGIRVIHPLRDGVIADLDATAEMLHGFLRASSALSGPFKQRAIVCVRNKHGADRLGGGRLDDAPGGRRSCACRAARPGWNGGQWSPCSAPGGRDALSNSSTSPSRRPPGPAST